MVEPVSVLTMSVQRGNAPLFDAAGKGHHKAVQLLLHHGADANVKDHQVGGWASDIFFGYWVPYVPASLISACWRDVTKQHIDSTYT